MSKVTVRKSSHNSIRTFKFISKLFVTKDISIAVEIICGVQNLEFIFIIRKEIIINRFITDYYVPRFSNSQRLIKYIKLVIDNPNIKRYKVCYKLYFYSYEYRYRVYLPICTGYIWFISMCDSTVSNICRIKSWSYIRWGHIIFPKRHVECQLVELSCYHIYRKITETI